MSRQHCFAIIAVGVVVAAGVPAFRRTAIGAKPEEDHPGGPRFEVVELNLTPSSTQLAACMPDAHVTVTVRLTTDVRGFDVFHVEGDGLPPNTTFTVFLLEMAGAPFGAAEYIGDFTSDDQGQADNTFRLIVAEAFSSTLVGGQRMRVELNQVGAWFADPTGDDFCLGPGGGAVTPFDGDNEAGVQAFNSAHTTPLPPP